MASTVIIVISAVLVSIFSQTTAIFCINTEATCIKCYICDTSKIKSCGDPFMSDGIPTCLGTGCLKTTSTIYGIYAVNRNCTQGDIRKLGCFSNTTPEGHSALGCQCTSNLCNASPATKPGLVLLVFSAMFAVTMTISSKMDI